MLSIGERIKQIRKEKGITQRELVRYTYLSINAISKLEQGLVKNPTIRSIAIMARLLDISLDEVIKRTELEEEINHIKSTFESLKSFHNKS